MKKKKKNEKKMKKCIYCSDADVLQDATYSFLIIASHKPG